MAVLLEMDASRDPATHHAGVLGRHQPAAERYLDAAEFGGSVHFDYGAGRQRLPHAAWPASDFVLAAKTEDAKARSTGACPTTSLHGRTRRPVHGPGLHVSLIDDDILLSVSQINTALHLGRTRRLDVFSPSLSRQPVLASVMDAAPANPHLPQARPGRVLMRPIASLFMAARARITRTTSRPGGWTSLPDPHAAAAARSDTHGAAGRGDGQPPAAR
ncbi:hypothetical protein ACRAWF_44060 [Streptomyces sp. L7]